MLRLVALAVLSMATFVAAAGTAEAKVFRGKTNQGRAASVVIGSDGLLRTVKVGARGSPTIAASAGRGRFRGKILVTRRGRYVDTCRSGRVRFTVRPD